MKSYFFCSLLLAAIGATPVALACVTFRGASLDLSAGREAVHAATLLLMQTFVTSFDLSVVAMWLPCALVLWRMEKSRGMS